MKSPRQAAMKVVAQAAATSGDDRRRRAVTLDGDEWRRQRR